MILQDKAKVPKNAEGNRVVSQSELWRYKKPFMRVLQNDGSLFVYYIEDTLPEVGGE